MSLRLEMSICTKKKDLNICIMNCTTRRDKM